VAQRLLRRVCEACRQEYEISDTVYTKMGIARIMPDKDRKFFKPIGCDKCFKTGYKGRIGITEILVLTPKVKDAILRRSGEINIKAIGRREGMITMREDGLIKASRGLTTLEEVVRVTAPDEELK
jgi:type II secretory ATPase GspE/PulE/Tfp pilus assembly ATPase PilB-like protein